MLLKEIARRKLGGDYRDCDASTRVVIKQLTGYEYDQGLGRRCHTPGCGENLSTVK